jgi:hypothetical protein
MEYFCVQIRRHSFILVYYYQVLLVIGYYLTRVGTVIEAVQELIVRFQPLLGQFVVYFS